jgi:dTDP-4-amino-4,6-dideoxygalactose transaminase
MRPIQMVDLGQQYLKIKEDVTIGIQSVIDTTSFIKGTSVSKFEYELGTYVDGAFLIGCGNGTDALQIELMDLELKRGDEVIVPAFTYVATIEVIGLLGLIPVLVDVDEDSFNIDISKLSNALTSKTKAIVPVHLYGQPANMGSIMGFAKKHGLFVIEDTAQAIGAECTSGSKMTKVSTIGDVGCLSFFPSKNLGCYGDGGALVTGDEQLAKRIKMVANHGQSEKYKHDLIGVNSRLDSIQAAILSVKLPLLDTYSQARNNVANAYDNAFAEISDIITPRRSKETTHVFHQYTLRVLNGKRDALKIYLSNFEIPSMIYYPIPVHLQKGYVGLVNKPMELPVTEKLSEEVLSLPIHTEMDKEQQGFIIKTVKSFFE